MHPSAALLCVLGLGMGVASAQEVNWNQLARTFLVYHQQPLNVSAAKEAGWSPMANCVDELGVAWGPDGGSKLTDHSPFRIYYTAAGQFAGISVNAFGDLPSTLVPQWWQPYDDSSRTISATFREPGSLCNPSTTFPELIGDRIVINAASTAFNVPLTDSDAEEQGWIKGACISGMGTHWAYDFANAPSFAFNASTMVPVMPMYMSGALSAILVAAPVAQQDVPFIGDWEGPFINTLMCYNFCSSECASSFKDSGVDLWNTMHFLLHPHKENTCEASCA